MRKSIFQFFAKILFYSSTGMIGVPESKEEQEIWYSKTVPLQNTRQAIERVLYEFVLKGIKLIQFPSGAFGSLSCILSSKQFSHGSFLCILNTSSRAFVQELKIQSLPVFGSPAGRFGLQPGLFYCLRQIGGFVCSVSLRKYAAAQLYNLPFAGPSLHSQRRATLTAIHSVPPFIAVNVLPFISETLYPYITDMFPLFSCYFAVWISFYCN